MNRFEVAILRILIKNQKPLSTSHLIDGFPDNSEDFVIHAITNLVSSGYIKYLYIGRAEYITYNKQKRKEILSIIDPLPQLGVEESSFCKDQVTYTNYIESKNNNKNRRSHYLATHRYVGKVALVTSLMLIGIVSAFSSSIPTASVYHSFGLPISDDYHSRNNDVQSVTLISLHQHCSLEHSATSNCYCYAYFVA